MGNYVQNFPISNLKAIERAPGRFETHKTINSGSFIVSIGIVASVCIFFNVWIE